MGRGEEEGGGMIPNIHTHIYIYIYTFAHCNSVVMATVYL